MRRFPKFLLFVLGYVLINRSCGAGHWMSAPRAFPDFVIPAWHAAKVPILLI